MGEWLEYEEGNTPWERSKHHLCNMWDEWEGMQHIVREGPGSRFSLTEFGTYWVPSATILAPGWVELLSADDLYIVDF